MEKGTFEEEAERGVVGAVRLSRQACRAEPPRTVLRFFLFHPRRCQHQVKNWKHSPCHGWSSVERRSHWTGCIRACMCGCPPDDVDRDASCRFGGQNTLRMRQDGTGLSSPYHDIHLSPWNRLFFLLSLCLIIITTRRERRYLKHTSFNIKTTVSRMFRCDVFATCRHLSLTSRVGRFQTYRQNGNVKKKANQIADKRVCKNAMHVGNTVVKGL